MSSDQVDDVDARFAILFAQQRLPALRLAYVLCGDAQSAEDVVAEAFARMYPAWRRGRIDDPVAYLRRAVVNEVRGGFRKLGVRRRHETGSPSTVPADGRIEDREVLRSALMTLPPRQRAAVALRFLEDLSEADTAAALGVSVGTVKSQVSRGLDLLRAALAVRDAR